MPILREHYQAGERSLTAELRPLKTLEEPKFIMEPCLRKANSSQISIYYVNTTSMAMSTGQKHPAQYYITFI